MSDSELTQLLEGMADSLDEHVTHEDIHRLLMEALELSMAQDAENSRKPRTITTAEELDALPVGSAVLDADHDVSTKHADKWHGYEMAPLDSRKFSKCGPFTVLYEPTP